MHLFRATQKNGNARSDYGPPGEGDGCWYFGGSGCVKFSHNNCAAEAHNNCEGFTTQPGHPEWARQLSK